MLPFTARRLGDVAYGVACLVLFCLVGAPLWLLVLALPRLSWRWRLIWAAGKLVFWCLGAPVKLSGPLPPQGRPCVIVANHQSFLDSFVLVTLFRGPVVFAAGGVLARQRIAGPFLRRVGCAFVRLEAGAGRSSVRSVLNELASQVRAGQRLVFFPEGGLSAEPGLRRFQLGAFVVACEAGSPVVPLAILGTREMLPPGARLPRRAALQVRVGQPLVPAGPGWGAAHQVARQAHDAVGALLGGLAR